MATTVQTIVENSYSIIVSTINNSAWRKLRFVQDLTRNSEADAKKAYGVRPGEAAPSDAKGLLGYETFDQTFEFVLSDCVARGDSDDEVQTILNDLYNKADLIFKQFVTTRLNLAASVIKVDERSMGDPEIVNKTQVFLRVRFVVTYRQSLT